MKDEKVAHIRIIVNEFIDFWLEYLSILKIFIEPDPSNILIFQISDVFKYRFTDTIKNCYEIESKIVLKLQEIKAADIKFYEEFKNDLERKIRSVNKSYLQELFLNHEPLTIPPKSRFVVSYLRQELIDL